MDINCSLQSLKNTCKLAGIDFKQSSTKTDLINILVSRGYEDVFYCHKKEILKIELAKRGLPTSGSKEELVERLRGKNEIKQQRT
jgi:hypothetical protein